MALTKLDAFMIEEDALSNHFELNIPVFPSVIDIDGTVLRIKTFDIPPTTIGTYTVTKGGKKADRPSGVQETPNEFTVTYPIDKNFKIYNGFEAWVQLIAPDQTGGRQIAEANMKIDMEVIAKDGNGDIRSGGWKFTGCWPSDHSGFTFDEENGDPIDITLTFKYTTKVPIGALANVGATI